MGVFDRIVENKILTALEDGEFDHLPGAGKPLELEDDTFVDPDMRLANHLLRSNGFAPSWAQARRDIELELEQARNSLARSWRAYQAAGARPGANADWDRAKQDFGSQIEQVNRRIFVYNIGVPSTVLQRRPVDVDRELCAVEEPAGGDLL